LPTRYFAIVVIFLAVIIGLNIFLSNKRIACVVMMVICLAMSVVEFMGYNMLKKAEETIDSLSNETQITVMEIRALSGHAVEKVEDFKDYNVGIMTTRDRKYADNTINEINKAIGGEVTVIECDDDIFTLVDKLYAEEVDAIVINSALVDMIVEEEGYTDFLTKTKSVHAVEISETIQKQEPPTVEPEKPFDITKDPFAVYISGIDTYGSVTRKSRSDVNIVMVVNPTTKKILLVNTPRDFYVPLPISDGVPDKLTHAGIYGVDVSVGALEMLYDIDIKYYLRMNFTGFITIIDALGGIDVYSKYEFSKGGYTFVKGENKNLSGEAALVFARERKSFASGDRQRGKNQMAVITAMIKKMASSQLLYNYYEIMDAVSGSFQTSLSSEEIYSLVKMQIDNMVGWEITSHSADGNGASMTTFTRPNNKAYVMVPNEDTITAAKEKIAAIMSGN